jgi:hypothetical protein
MRIFGLRGVIQQQTGGDAMAAFCGCCGAEITAKDAACRVCGTPRHGMLRADGLTPLDIGDEFVADEGRGGEGLGGSRSCDRW